jgi:hypothetical protein
MSTILNQDVANNDTFAEFDETDAADAFAKLWDEPDAETPSGADDEDKKKKAAKPEDDNEDADEGAEGDDENSEETPEDEDDAEGDDEGSDDEEDADDKVVIKHTVDGEEREFTLGQLKRLAGQEASLTRKGQEVAETRKKVEEQATYHASGLKVLLDRAKERFAPYAKIDLLAAAKDPNISAEELAAVRNAAQAAYADVQFLEGELGNVTSFLQKQQHEALVEEAKEAIKVLSDPKTGIEGWSEKLYGEIRTFATDNGLSPDIVNKLVDPAAIKLINMARLYAKGKSKVVSEKSDKKKAPKRIVKSTATAATTKKAVKSSKNNDAFARLQKSGSVDDAADAFMANWSQGDED